MDLHDAAERTSQRGSAAGNWDGPRVKPSIRLIVRDLVGRSEQRLDLRFANALGVRLAAALAAMNLFPDVGV